MKLLYTSSHKLLFLFSIFFSLFSFSQTKIFVKHDATGGNNGTSWSTAFNKFQDAVNAANAGDSVFVAAGEYQPAYGQFYS